MQNIANAKVVWFKHFTSETSWSVGATKTGAPTYFYESSILAEILFSHPWLSQRTDPNKPDRRVAVIECTVSTHVKTQRRDVVFGVSNGLMLPLEQLRYTDVSDVTGLIHLQLQDFIKNKYLRKVL